MFDEGATPGSSSFFILGQKIFGNFGACGWVAAAPILERILTTLFR
jgi:hypothetical protein